MTLPQWFDLYCDQILGIPKSQRTKYFDQMKKKAGRVGERLVKERYLTLGYKVIRQNQYDGGFDFFMKKKDPFFAPHYPDEIHIEVKVNTSKPTKKQKEVEEEITRKGGTYWYIRYNVPLLIAGDMVG
jgi:hypothetical protein